MPSSLLAPYVPDDPHTRQAWGAALWIAYHTPTLQTRFLHDVMPCARLLAMGQSLALPYASDDVLVTAFTAWFTAHVWPTWEEIDLTRDDCTPPEAA